MKAIESAVLKLKNSRQAITRPCYFTDREVETLIAAGELLASLARAVEVGATITVPELSPTDDK